MYNLNEDITEKLILTLLNCGMKINKDFHSIDNIPSQWVAFSDARNNYDMINKWIKLQPKFFQVVLFVKRNSKYI